jgi:hypothetical protein
LACAPHQRKNEIAVFLSLERVGAHTKEASKATSIVRTAVEVELSFERLERNAVRGFEQNERLDSEAVGECVSVPDRGTIVAPLDDLQRADPAHHATQQNVSGGWLPLVFLHRLAKAADCSARSAKLLPRSSRK